MALLLRSRECCRCLLPDIVIDMSGVNRLLTCTWSRSGKLLLSGDLGFRVLLPDSSVRSLCGRPGTQGDPETTLGSVDGDGPP
jgi:hypothetical protein